VNRIPVEEHDRLEVLCETRGSRGSFRSIIDCTYSHLQGCELQASSENRALAHDQSACAEDPDERADGNRSKLLANGVSRTASVFEPMTIRPAVPTIGKFEKDCSGGRPPGPSVAVAPATPLGT
jgi:hypothetical protein